MPYIGRNTDKLSNVEVLDNITFDGSSSYTLQKGGSNFTPSSANTLLVSIDGVVQAGNFTVSGSTIDFGTAVAGTSTCDFILHYGIGLITTPADGTVTSAKISYPLTTFSSTGIDDNASSTSITIDSSGNVSVGTTEAPATVATTSSVEGLGYQANDYLAISRAGTSEQGNLILNKLTNDGDIIVLNKNGTRVGSIDVSSTGMGLYLGGTGTANKLDDYEEGTWTPVFAGSTTAGSFTYTTQVGTYTKIGRLVTVNCELLNITEVSGAVGSLKITGLPFTASSTNNSFGSCDINRFSFTGYEYAVANLGTSKNFVYILRVRTGNSSAILDVSHRDGDSSDVKFTISYEV